MANYGLTENGFIPKRLSDIRDSLQVRLSTLRDPESGESLQINWDENDPTIQIINAFCDELATCWQLAYQVYSQFNPQNAVGASLSGLVQLNGILRKKGTPSTVVLTFTGAENTFIPAGTVVTDENGEMGWETMADATIPLSGSIDVNAKSEQNGIFIYDAGQINTLANALEGITAVVNANQTIAGTADENDASLRLRRGRSTEIASSGMAESIYSSVMNIPGVTYCRVFTNRTLQEDDKGIPAKSVAVIVQGGDDNEIAKQIFIHSGLGCGYYGNVTVNFIDSLSIVTPVSFSRPVQRPVQVYIKASKVEGSQLPLDWQEQIKSNIINYALLGPQGIGITGIADDFGFPPSENVAVSRLYIPVGAVQGVKIDSLKICFEGDVPETEDLIIGWQEIAEFSNANIFIEGE